MKTNPLLKIASLLTASVIVAGFTASASAAGPMTYLPVKSAKAASALKVGSAIAFSCDKCHAVTVTTVDSKKSFLTGITCPSCKQTFAPNMSSGERRAGSRRAWSASAHFHDDRGLPHCGQ